MYFLKNGGIYFGSNILNALIPFILLPLLTRYLTTEEYGEVAIFISLAGVFSALIGASLLGSVSRKYFDEGVGEISYSYYAGSAVQLIVVGVVIVGGILFYTIDFVSDFVKVSSFVVWCSLYFALSSTIIQLKLNQFQIRKKAIEYGKVQVSWAALNGILSIIAVVILGFGVCGRIGAQLVACSVILLFSIYLLVRKNMIRGLLESRPGNYKELLLFGLPLVPHVLGGYFLNSFDRLVIGQNLGLSAAGVYAVAFQLAAASGLIFDALNKAIQPWFYESLQKKLGYLDRRIIVFTYGWFLSLFAGLAIVYIVGPGFVVFLVGERFADSAHIFLLLMVAQVFKGMYFSVINYCFFAKRTGYLSLVSVFSGILNVVLIYSFVTDYGIRGVAYAYIISMFVRFFLVWFFAAKAHPMPWLNPISSSTSNKVE